MQFRHQFVRSLFTSVTWWLGVAASLVAFYFANQMVERERRNQFDYHASNAKLAIESRIHSYIDVLRATRAMIHANGTVTRQEFHTFVAELNLARGYPGINNLNFAQRVLDREKSGYESAVRLDRSVEAEGYPDFAVTSAGERPEYHVLTYLEPMEGNRGSLGYDLASNPRVEKALAYSRDTGELTSSGRLIRIQGQEKIIGFAMRMPLYRKGMPLNTVSARRDAYYGSVGVGLDINKIIQATVDRQGLPQLRIRLYDTGRVGDQLMTGTSDPERLLFDSVQHATPVAGGDETASAQDSFASRTSVAVGSRIWEIEFSAPKNAMSFEFDQYLPWLVLAGGLLGTLLLYGNQYGLTTARSRALEIAREMTKDLRTSRADLAEAQHMARLGSWVLDPVADSMAWSDETYRIFGGGQAQRQPAYGDFLMRIMEEDRQRVRDGLETSIRTGVEFNNEHRIVRYDGVTRWVQTIARPERVDHKRVLRGTIMDVNERKHNVDALKRSQELLRDLTAHQDRIKEDERKRIAREIHDELGQTMLALRIDVSMLDTRTAISHPKINERVRSVLHHIDATVKTIRTIINNLRPAVLDLGLTAAVEWQVSQFQRRSAIECELVMGAREFALSDARATTLFRILQESLTNVIRHANATKVRIELYEEENNLVMKITDNGIGIMPGNRRKSEAFGLVGIEERVLALNGAFMLESAPNSGTALIIYIPMEVSDDSQAEMSEH